MTQLSIRLKWRLLAVPVLALTALACASQGAPKFDQVDTPPDPSLAGYDKVYVADVTVADELASRETAPFKSTSGQEVRAVSATDLASKARDVQEELVDQLGKSKQVVDAPGTDVLTVSAMLVDIASNRPTQADLESEASLSHRSLYTGRSEIRVDFSNQGRNLGSVTESYDGTFTDSVGNPAIWHDADQGIFYTADKVARLLNE